MYPSKTKSVYVLLTHYNDLFSRFFKFILGATYTHSSIGIQEDSGTFFSFVTKGFREEHPTKSKNPEKQSIPCALYQIEVSEAIYEDIKKRIRVFVDNPHQYQYSYLGAWMGVALGIPLRCKQRYFCSQFVAELLLFTGAAALRLRPAIYHPDYFEKEEACDLVFKGTLGGLASFLESNCLSHEPPKLFQARQRITPPFENGRLTFNMRLGK